MHLVLRCMKSIHCSSLTFQEVFLYCSAISWKLYRIRNNLNNGRLTHISLETLEAKGPRCVYHLWSKNQANNNVNIGSSHNYQVVAHHN